MLKRVASLTTTNQAWEILQMEFKGGREKGESGKVEKQSHEELNKGKKNEVMKSLTKGNVEFIGKITFNYKMEEVDEYKSFVSKKEKDTISPIKGNVVGK